MSGKYNVTPPLRQTKVLLIDLVSFAISLSGYKNSVGVVLILYNLPASTSCNFKNAKYNIKLTLLQAKFQQQTSWQPAEEER